MDGKESRPEYPRTDNHNRNIHRWIVILCCDEFRWYSSGNVHLYCLLCISLYYLSIRIRYPPGGLDFRNDDHNNVPCDGDKHKTSSYYIWCRPH